MIMVLFICKVSENFQVILSECAAKISMTLFLVILLQTLYKHFYCMCDLSSSRKTDWQTRGIVRKKGVGISGGLHWFWVYLYAFLGFCNRNEFRGVWTWNPLNTSRQTQAGRGTCTGRQRDRHRQAETDMGKQGQTHAFHLGISFRQAERQTQAGRHRQAERQTGSIGDTSEQ